MTGGKYYRADNAERFQQIYAEIDKLEKSEAVVKKYTEFNELFAWFLIPGLGLLLLEQILKNTVMRRPVAGLLAIYDLRIYDLILLCEARMHRALLLF